MHKTRSELRDSFLAIGQEEQTTKVSLRCNHYAKYYADKLFEYQDQKINFLELGAHQGGSARLWNRLFPKWTLTYLDNDLRYTTDPNEPARRMPENVPVYVGDQTDETLLHTLIEERGPFDIILDDASHEMEPTWASFSTLFNLGLKNPGLYIIEDLHTSYWPCSGGKLHEPGTVIENLKLLIDEMSYTAHVGDVPENRPPSGDRNFAILTTDLQKTLTEVSFCPDIAFVYKGENFIDDRPYVEHPGVCSNHV